MFAMLAVEIKELHQLDLDGLSDDELRTAAVELDRLASSLDAARTEVLAAFDARRAWSDSGARTCSAFLAPETGRPKKECASRLALGRPSRADAHVRRVRTGGRVLAPARRSRWCERRRRGPS